MSSSSGTVAELIVRCLEAEGVRYMFGIPGEENIRLVDATAGSSIRFVLVRHEQAASFMADIYGRLTGKAAVCTATLGPGAINLLLGVADANTDSTPLVALTAQVGLNRIYKESHQYVDLESMFRPVTKWAATITTAPAVPEMMRKAFDLAHASDPALSIWPFPRISKRPRPPWASSRYPCARLMRPPQIRTVWRRRSTSCARQDGRSSWPVTVWHAPRPPRGCKSCRKCSISLLQRPSWPKA